MEVGSGFDSANAFFPLNAIAGVVDVQMRRYMETEKYQGFNVAADMERGILHI